MPVQTEVKVDEKKLQSISRQFSRWPQAVPRVVRDAVNKTGSKTRTAVVRRVAQQVKGMRTKDIRDRTKLRKASLQRLMATINISGRGVPVGNLGMKKGRVKTVYHTASERQSMWLYYNVFKPKYGEAAVFSRNYRIRRKAYPNVTYQVMGRTVHIYDPNYFVQTVKNPWASASGGGHTGVFFRREGYRGRAIKEVYGPGLASMLENVNDLKMIEEGAGEDLSRNIDAQVKRYLEKMRRSA